MDSGGGNSASSDPSKTTETAGCGCGGSGSSPSCITVRVTPTTGGQFDLQVTKTDSVENLKKLISKKLKVPKERICLLHRDRQLRDGTLQENQLMDGSRLTLLPSVETGLLAQRPEQSVMQALESLNDSQVNDFLSGKAPLNLTMRLGDHMMLIQLQLSTVTPSSSRRATPAPAATATATTTTTTTTATTASSSRSSAAPSKAATTSTHSGHPKAPSLKAVAASTPSTPSSSPWPLAVSSTTTTASPSSPSPSSAAPTSGLKVVPLCGRPFPKSLVPGDPPSALKSLEDAAHLLSKMTSECSQQPASSSSSSSSSSPPPHCCSAHCKCDAAVKPTLDTRALAEASRNLTQTLKQLSSEVLTSRSDPAEDSSRSRRQGAIIESMHHHGKGVYSGTFSGTLNPALQDRFGRPKRDISTIIHILNDLLCATPQYRRHARQGHTITVEAAGSTAAKAAPADKAAGTMDLMEESVSLSRENQATRGKMEHLRLIMEERRARRRARREARAAPYTTQWSAKSESVSQPTGLGHDAVEPMETAEQASASASEQQLCELNPPEPVVA